MGMCKKCNGVFGATEMENRVCKYCITGEAKPAILIKTPKTYLTDDERAKIIEEETLRDSIRYENASGGMINTITNISGVIFMMIMGVFLIVGTIGFFVGMK